MFWSSKQSKQINRHPVGGSFISVHGILEVRKGLLCSGKEQLRTIKDLKMRLVYVQHYHGDEFFETVRKMTCTILASVVEIQIG